MKVAVKLDLAQGGPQIDEQGRLVTDSAGTTLAARLLRLYPDAVLVGPAPRSGPGIQVVRLTDLAPAETLLVNMDPLDSVACFQVLHRHRDEPRIMNFAWTNPSSYHHPINFAALGLSFAAFPTFCNSERTAGEVHEVLQHWAVPHLAASARIDWANLGVRLERVRSRTEPEVPVVLYPAITLEDRKQPAVFMDVVRRVAKRVPLRAEARLQERHLTSTVAMDMTRDKWMWVGPLTSREGYWEALSRTTAFLATATQESYGLEYVEAMIEGVIGILPDVGWARALVPASYPYLYDSPAVAEEMLAQALTQPQECRRALDACAGGSFADWLRARHDDDDFERAFTTRVRQWFGAEAATTEPIVEHRHRLA
ncbi:glycosyltransferase [Arsenicicoccus sp. oral taxon 190]|uniref:glycosyltransferase n=1 Tax=Arsenicicoccus sp. oral taxon 190 TaxID=1658671 RepID=UPI00067A157D|nr:glycosyltransferase [Arsenicicoccus sp. oral taxon 190]AKT51014.1 hypothetical protein ADJ73_06255 [Arsenicicoccus sp. oral taxon 190]